MAKSAGLYHWEIAERGIVKILEKIICKVTPNSHKQLKYYIFYLKSDMLFMAAHSYPINVQSFLIYLAFYLYFLEVLSKCSSPFKEIPLKINIYL